MKKIFKELENIKNNYSKTIDLVDGLKFSQKDTIRTIEFYNNSKYLNGQKDELGRDKPFFQILNAIADVENAAKDVNTSDISVTSDDHNHYLESQLLSKDVYVWMKESNFAKTLNDMRDTHTRYGSLLVKKVMKDINGKKKLQIEIPEWKNVMTDQVDIVNNAIVETHWMSAGELVKMDSWEKKEVKEVLKKFKNQETLKRVPVYEIRGWFPVSYIKDLDKKKISDEDEITYTYQLYYLAGIPTESKTDFVNALVPLYWENDTEQVYKYLKRKPKAGRDFGVGVFEEGEEAQVWTNDAVLKQHRAMEYTTKVVAQSASKKLKGRNLRTEVDDGVILEHEDGKPITPLNLLPSGGLNQYTNIITQWYNQLEKTTSAYSAQRGDTPPSGTPFRLQATVLQQSSSVFKTLQQEFGIFITELFEDWVMPYLATQLTREHILAYEFSPEELKDIDTKFSTNRANAKGIELILDNRILTQEEYDGWVESASDMLKQTKAQRFIDIPKNYYKNLEMKVTVNTTGEQRNKAATLESLNNILITYLSNEGASQDPVATLILSRIVELADAGISPVSITNALNEKSKSAQVQQDQLAQQQVSQPQPQVKKPSLVANTQ